MTNRTLLEDYGAALDTLARRTCPVGEAAVELGKFGGIDVERPLVTVTRGHLKAALADYTDGRMSREELRLWAELLPDRPGIRFERRYATRIRTVLGDLQRQPGNTWFSPDDQIEQIGQFLDIPDRPLRNRLRTLGDDRITMACFTIMFQATLIIGCAASLPQGWPTSARIAVTAAGASPLGGDTLIAGSVGSVARSDQGVTREQLQP